MVDHHTLDQQIEKEMENRDEQFLKCFLLDLLLIDL